MKVKISSAFVWFFSPSNGIYNNLILNLVQILLKQMGKLLF